MRRLTFPDGTVLSGKTSEAVLRAWGGLQWQPTGDLWEIRTSLVHRARVWSGAEVDPTLPDDEFLAALHDSTLCAVSFDGEKAKPPAMPDWIDGDA